jgi:hypothetical protein
MCKACPYTSGIMIPAPSAPVPGHAADATPDAKRSVRDLRDFPDRFSPMLVKELRQGLRSKLFVGAFLTLHIVLVLITLVTLAADNARDSGMLFWWGVAIGLAVLMPLSGFNALVDERALNTMDTLILTKLSAWRIVVGKWSAISARIILLVTTIVPYLVLRYFSGGVDMAREMQGLLLFTLLALLFTSITVGFSWIKFFVLRGLFTLAGGFGVCMLIGFSIFVIIFPVGFYSRGVDLGFWGYTIIMLMVAYVIFFFLDTGAAAIAPVSENRTTLRRVVTVAVLALMLGLCSLFQSLAKGKSGSDYDDLAEMLAVLSLLLAGWAAVDACTERPKHVSVISHPFVKRGPLGILAGRFLYPGWHSGIFYTLFLMVFPVFALEVADMWRPEPAFVILCCFGQAMLGILILRIFFRESTFPFVMFWIIQVAMFLLMGLCAILAESTRTDGLYLLPFPFPAAYLFYVEEARHYSTRYSDTRFMVAAAYVLVYYGALLILSAREFGKTGAAERQARHDLQPPSVAAAE